MTRIGWREAYKALTDTDQRWTLSGNHLLLDGFTYYYLTGASLERLHTEIGRKRGGAA
jgi:hypothetical protein